MKKLVARWMVALLMSVFLTGNAGAVAWAAEITEINKLMVANEQLSAKAEPDEDGEKVVTYEENAYVLVTGETDDGWYQVLFQDKVGYIQKEQVRENLEEDGIAALDKEMEEQRLEDQVLSEEIEREWSETRRSTIWGVVIVAVLVIAFFAVGIYSAVQAARNAKKEEES